MGFDEFDGRNLFGTEELGSLCDGRVVERRHGPKIEGKWGGERRQGQMK